MGYTNFINNGQPAINDTNLKNMQKELMKLVFPIGSTYITQSADTNPSTILEFGTWERVKGRVLVGIDEDSSEFQNFGQEGGEKAHTLTQSELPNINFAISNGNKFHTTDSGTGLGVESNITGGNQPINITQLYKVVGYMWIRTE